MKNVTIDWGWVKKQVLEKERIGCVREPHQKEIILKTVDECMSAAEGLARPRVVSAKKALDSVDLGKKTAGHLKGAKHLEVFVVTAGKRLEEEAARLMKETESLKGYLLDRIGSFAAESLAQNTEEALRKKYAKNGSSVSMRRSPGYCGFPIEEQFRLSRLVPFSKAGVRLNKSCMMIPRKSISAVVGVGPSGLFRKVKSPCRICDMKECGYKRV